MQRLLSEFGTMFDLDQTVHGARLGDLVVRTIDELESKARPDWGSVGPIETRSVSRGESTDFYYAPHLFPDMEQTLRLAHKLQFHMLPMEAPADSPVRLAAVLESYCHLSGDLFGWEVLSDGSLLIWIADIAGHGVRAGLASAILKILIANLPRRGDLESLVAELNNTLLRCLRDDKSALYATGFFMTFDRGGAARYTSAGHPPTLLRRSGGKLEELESTAMPIGMFTDRRYPSREFRLDRGDTMLLFTDGVIESSDHNKEQFGVERLRATLAENHESPRELTHAIYRRLAKHQDMDKLGDDVTFVAARFE